MMTRPRSDRILVRAAFGAGTPDLRSPVAAGRKADVAEAHALDFASEARRDGSTVRTLCVDGLTAH